MRSQLLTFTISFFLSSLALAQLPYLDKSSTSPRMMVDGKPFIILGGELHNSTASDKTALPRVFEEMKALNFNTVLTYAYWEHLEPVEGQFDFDLVDAAIEAARAQEIKLIMVWFGSWKSTASTYAPAWVKTNPDRFKRYTLEDGSTLEILSPFYEENKLADAKAYTALMRHIKEVDFDHTVIMMQVENEPGCFDNYRDFSEAAQKAWNSPIPKQMTDYLKKNKGNLFPELEKVWKENGYKTQGTWEEILGKGKQEGDYKFYTEELFMAYNYSTYIDYIAAEGRKILDLPAFCNGWLYNNRGFYPHGTVNPHVLDAYKAGGDALDFYSPNVYTIDYDGLFSLYTLGGNTLFVPESMFSPAGALYAIGAYSSLGFAPFGVDDPKTYNENNAVNLRLMKEIYKTLPEMNELITSNYSSEKMKAVYLNADKKKQTISIGDYILKAESSDQAGFSLDFGKSLEQRGQRRMGPPVAEQNDDRKAAPTPFGVVPEGLASAIVIEVEKGVFYIVGYGVKFSFDLKENVAFKHLNYLSIDEGTFENNEFQLTKRWNGDEQKVSLPSDKLTVLKVSLYHY